MYGIEFVASLSYSLVTPKETLVPNAPDDVAKVRSIPNCDREGIRPVITAKRDGAQTGAAE
eukprot:CAMPEP_0202691810 /NCGR_PEP_ID=MMETSP1385-20130828/6414_1 /ASSEMBLY_ACC=CAM_ASM_000861 /TAXON_ID=933848 /ORGANISM="Elphidium margaritaceum" /LENGTH=60 /DNA_ID=CAMNT_0049347263 /DNA_START=439 /DNA_END=621 /DNA_ORIENTATION=-